jgi:sugar phosphate isomerase/epimerase
MSSPIRRRDFLRTTGALGAGIGLFGLGSSELLAAALANGAPNAEKLGWHLGCQTWTFREFSLFEAIDKTASLGLHYVETGAGMKSLSKEQPHVKFTEDSPVSVRNEVKKKLADSGVMLKSYGVTPLSKDVGQCRKMFDFAKDMGIETIVSEPTEDAFDTIEKLCDQYAINLAIHNHPNPSHYWTPDTVLRVCKGRSKRLGACADTGHWLRSGLNPVECLKKLEGRIINFHFKDLNKAGGDARDVPWGTGVSDVKGMLTEVRRQGIKAVFLIEYEYLSPTLVQEVVGCVNCFDKVAAELAAKA